MEACIAPVLCKLDFLISHFPQTASISDSLGYVVSDTV